jgi:hypothetical protein
VTSLQTLAGILGLAAAAGVNLYAVILTVGLGLRYGWIGGLPEQMQMLAHPAVLIAAGVLYMAEFVADKIPFVTPIWDAIHTFIRPLGAAILALEASAELSPPAKIAAVLAAGSLALGTHATKAGFRLTAHAVPEPATHSVISILEDFGVVGLVLLVYSYPLIALGVLAVILVALFFLARVVWRGLRSLLRAGSGVLRGGGPGGTDQQVLDAGRHSRS